MDLQNYHDWTIERQRLLGRIKELEAENAELKKRLGEDVVPVVREPTAMKKLSAQEKVELFRSLFKGREEVFVRRWYRTSKAFVSKTAVPSSPNDEYSIGLRRI